MSTEENHNQNNVTITEPESEVKAQTELKPDDWLCMLCSKKITEDKERFPYDGQTEFHFTNPDGYVFDIITFRTAAMKECRLWNSPGLMIIHGLLQSAAGAGFTSDGNIRVRLRRIHFTALSNQG